MIEETFLSVDKLRKSYGDLIAVDDISFSVRRGEVFGFLGPNGAGKTTTIKMICGLLKSSGGAITYGGISMSKDYSKIKSLIGLCPQDIVIWELLTCMEQLKFMGISYGLKPKQAVKRAEEILEKLGLSEKRNKLARTLSGGMQRRLNIALALIHDPELIILDEPQAGLDPQSRVLVRDFVKELAKNKTIILTTHDMEEADRLSDRIAIIDCGRILTVGTPAEIKEKTEPGESMRMRERTLEDAFISMTGRGLRE